MCRKFVSVEVHLKKRKECKECIGLNLVDLSCVVQFYVENAIDHSKWMDNSDKCVAKTTQVRSHQSLVSRLISLQISSFSDFLVILCRNSVNLQLQYPNPSPNPPPFSQHSNHLKPSSSLFPKAASSSSSSILSSACPALAETVLRPQVTQERRKIIAAFCL